MDDKHFGADSVNRQVNVHSKEVFSFAMTLMDEIRGCVCGRVRGGEESWVGSKFATCMWIHTKEAFTGGYIFDREQEEHAQKRIISMIFCTNWICVGIFVDHDHSSVDRSRPWLPFAGSCGEQGTSLGCWLRSSSLGRHVKAE